MKTLVVDDDLTNRIILQKLLSPYGNVHTANDGVEAVDFVKLAIDKNENYDLICLDIMMPKMDGHEALEHIKNIEEEKKLTKEKRSFVIMTTALGDGKNIMDAFKSQCDAYIVKPIEKEKLEEILKKHELI